MGCPNPTNALPRQSGRRGRGQDLERMETQNQDVLYVISLSSFSYLKTDIHNASIPCNGGVRIPAHHFRIFSVVIVEGSFKCRGLVRDREGVSDRTCCGKGVYRCCILRQRTKGLWGQSLENKACILSAIPNWMDSKYIHAIVVRSNVLKRRCPQRLASWRVKVLSSRRLMTSGPRNGNSALNA